MREGIVIERALWVNAGRQCWLQDQCIISVDMMPSREVSLGRRCSQAVWNASDLLGGGLPWSLNIVAAQQYLLHVPVSDCFKCVAIGAPAWKTCVNIKYNYWYICIDCSHRLYISISKLFTITIIHRNFFTCGQHFHHEAVVKSTDSIHILNWNYGKDIVLWHLF